MMWRETLQRYADNSVRSVSVKYLFPRNPYIGTQITKHSCAINIPMNLELNISYQLFTQTLWRLFYNFVNFPSLPIGSKILHANFNILTTRRLGTSLEFMTALPYFNNFNDRLFGVT